jgi:O-acetyl-ADP-ribose deacetylase
MSELLVIQGDITTQAVDAIVNAANNSLLGGSGVDGAIHRAAGSQLLAECRQLDGCATGDAKITKGYNLPAKWIIHTVGPIWQGGDRGENLILANCYRRCLEIATEYQLKSIAFSAISTGVYHFPLLEATTIAVNEVKSFLATNPTSIELVIFVCFNDAIYNYYQQVLAKPTQ